MATDPRFYVVFEDRHLIVVDKGARLLTVPTPRGERNTLVDLLERYLERSGPRRRAAIRPNPRDRDGSGRSRPMRARAVEVVHRLDRDTSGLLVFPKDPRTADDLREQFRRHTVDRIYLAIVAGVVRDDEGTFDSYLTTSKGLHRHSTIEEGAGERAITHFRVRSRGPDTTVVDVQLETGRRNQIRVHFAEAGYPVLGDSRYGPRGLVHPHWTTNRLALHASVLALVHPATGKRIRWESPMPTVFRTFISRQAQRGKSS
jgi:23S rRNA pseudouridine1911/1915/1917 synthase